jgi:hypothetical protein
MSGGRQSSPGSCTSLNRARLYPLQKTLRLRFRRYVVVTIRLGTYGSMLFVSINPILGKETTR